MKLTLDDDDDDTTSSSCRYTVNLNCRSSSSSSSNDKSTKTLTLSQLGGKGLNLTKLVSASGASERFEVPPGFVVTVDSYKDYLERNQFLLPVIEKALMSPTPSPTLLDDPAALEKASKTIRTAFRRGKLSPELIHEIDYRMNEIKSTTTTTTSSLKKEETATTVPVAVRSSATAEDLPDLSFAGQQDTYLNVVGKEELYKSIIDCFASLFTARAIGYRQRNGIDRNTVGIAVVVQAMVPSDCCSGVLFTANPLNGRRTETVLEVVPGLGEALVSGLSEPDQYVVGAANNNNTTSYDEILHRRVGSKAVSIRAAPNGGVVRVEEAEEDITGGDSAATTAILEDDAVQELVRTGRVIEDVFGGVPQDIEFARYQGKNYIVQSRPITTLFPLPQGMSSSGNTTTDEPFKVMMSFGAVQGLATPFTPAGQDMIRLLMGGASSVFYGKRGMEERAKGVLHIAAERLFIDVTPLLRNSAGRKFAQKLFPVVEPGIAAGLRQVQDDPRLAVVRGLSPRFMLRVMSLVPIVFPRFLFVLFCPDRAREVFVTAVDERVAEVQKQCDKATDLEQVLRVQENAFCSFFPFLFKRFLPRMATAMGSLFKLRHMAESIPDGRDLVLTLTRGMAHNVTTEMDLQLWKVAQIIQKDTESFDCFQNFNAETLASDYLQNRLPALAQRAIKEFINLYGMRGFAEIDLGRPRWREDPTPLMQTLKSYIAIPKERAPDRVFQAGAQAADEAAVRLKQELGHSWLIDFCVRRIRALAGMRELPKFTIIRSMGIIRERLLKEGGRLVEAGVLDLPTDMFLLHRNELKALAARQDVDWKAVVAGRRARLDSESKRQRVPQLLASDGFTYYGNAEVRRSDQEASDNELYGDPVSPGMATGKVRIVLDPSQTQVLPGEVLVCPGTDPSWTPLFLSASALVTEVGGLMTHGSVVAREYGIAAVVGVEHCTEKLKTGETVVVDGSTGVVKRIDNGNEAEAS